MKVKDIVTLQEINENAKNLHIPKGCFGVIVKINENFYTVAFLDLKNNKCFDLVEMHESEIKLYEMNQNLSFDGGKINYLDIVELVADNLKYKKFGIYKGDHGVVLSENDAFGFYLVDFSDLRKGIYDACISVKSTDLKVIKSKTNL